MVIREKWTVIYISFIFSVKKKINQWKASKIAIQKTVVIQKSVTILIQLVFNFDLLLHKMDVKKVQDTGWRNNHNGK